ncbi:HAD-IA family hydrolase [Brevibacillus parabrevis]|uniref:HAD family hydrolase n=1 Tax=Brevibacillus parabrevis TaxID=54914 RepID=UPI0028D85A6D|nr:HAD-IA family hydrolase [Brevibacillus parabrevis]MED1725487.1 HAD-IA family hydrolase [Brevibacillus parabrevis]
MRTILFDFDGTVADTLPLIFTAFRSTFQRFLQEHYSDEQIVAMFGPTETGILQNKLPAHEHEAALDHFFHVYTLEHAQVQNPPQLAKMLDQLHSAGIQMGVVTGKGRRSADISLREWGLEKYFSVVITGDEVTEPKPHPEGIFTALKQLGATAENAIFVGDSDADIIAGRAAGLTTVGVDWLLVTQKAGSFDPEPDYRFSDAQAFVDWVLGS